MNATETRHAPLMCAHYKARRRRFEPENLELIIVAESPPISGLYFYDTSGSIREPLFAAILRQLAVKVASKEEGLNAIERRGWLLVDSTYQPVNSLSPKERDAVILRDYHLLREDINRLSNGNGVPIIILKANVCRLLEPKLTEDGFNVLNNGQVCFFPSTGHQKTFYAQFRSILNSAKLL